LEKSDLKISVIIPFYNSFNTIDNCLKSVLDCEYENIEVILINDGSTDNTLKIVEAFIENDCKFKLITTENKGQGHARNTGLKHASGELIVFLDADDELDANTLSDNIHFFNDSSIAFVQFPIVYNVNTVNPNLFAPTETVLSTSEAVLKSVFLNKTLTWLVCGKIFRRSFLKDHFFLENIFYEDNEMMLRLYAKAHKVVISNFGLYKYFYYPSSTSNSKDSFLQKNIDTLSIVETTIQFLKQHKLSKSIVVDYVSRSLNIRQSILKIDPNYQYTSALDINEISTFDVLKSNISIKEKLKLIFKLWFK
jgi:glycosyltransferase involved in cell wall biosynthesis